MIGGAQADWQRSKGIANPGYWSTSGAANMHRIFPGTVMGWGSTKMWEEILKKIK